MSKRAEEISASAILPESIISYAKEHAVLSGLVYRERVKYGYEQAEKDLALTWEDMKLIDCIFRDVAIDHTTGKFKPDNYKDWYGEALKRFNEQRNK